MPIGPIQLPDAVDQDQDYVWVQRQYAQRGSRTRRDQRPIRFEGRQSGQSLALKVGVGLAQEVGAICCFKLCCRSAGGTDGDCQPVLLGEKDRQSGIPATRVLGTGTCW